MLVVHDRLPRAGWYATILEKASSSCKRPHANDVLTLRGVARRANEPVLYFVQIIRREHGARTPP